MLDSKWHTVCSLGIWTLNALIFIAMVFTVFPANSAPKPNYAARLTADCHLQLEVTSLQLPNNMPGQCIVSGTIVRLFRAHADALDTGTASMCRCSARWPTAKRPYRHTLGRNVRAVSNGNGVAVGRGVGGTVLVDQHDGRKRKPRRLERGFVPWICAAFSRPRISVLWRSAPSRWQLRMVG